MNGKYWPDSSAYPEGRLFSLDLLRGLDVFWLVILHPLLNAAHRTWSLPDFWQIDHCWGVFGPFDFAQPLFVFICGAAVPFALPKRLDADGRPGRALWSHVLGRVALLWACGWLIRDALAFNLSRFTPYSDTLQTVAVGYLFACLAFFIRSRAVRIALPVVLVVAYAALLAAFGDYTPKGNFARIVDERVFGAIGCKAKDFTYCLTTMVWAALGMFGSLVSRFLKSDRSVKAKAWILAAVGVGLIAAGEILAIRIPVIRHIYTISFVARTMGMSVLLLTVLYVLTDIRRHRSHLGAFLLFGQYGLAAWMLFFFCYKARFAVAERFTAGFTVLFGSAKYTAFGNSVFAALVIFAALVVWRGWKNWCATADRARKSEDRG